MRTLDRYLIREILPPFLLALGVFTFILDIMPILDVASRFLAKGVPLPIVGKLLLWLLPSALGLTLPMAFLTGVLIALGRLSGDREAMAMLACGISPMRLFRPVLVAGLGAGIVTLYVMIWLLPDCNQRFTSIVWRLLTEQTDQDIKPGLFYEGFPGKVLYLQSSSPVDGWSGVFVADTSQTGRPSVAVAERGQLFLNRDRQQVVLSLFEANQYVPGADPRVYDIGRTASSEPLTFTIPASDVFPGTGHGFPEMSIAELKESIALEVRSGGSGRNQYFWWQQKFSFPVACLVFAIIALPIGLHTRKEGRLAGLVVGLGIVFVYYALMKIAESVTKGNLLPPVWARWVPNLVMGPIGVAALWWRARASGVEFTWLTWLMRVATGRRRRQDDPLGAPVTGLAVARSTWWNPLRLLDTYVSGKYVRILALAFFGLLGLYYIGAVLDLSDKVFKQQATMPAVARYVRDSTPQFVTFVVPIATLVAVLSTIGGLTRTSELTVMRACGVSLYRAAAPLVCLALMWSGLLFGLEEHLMAGANQKAQKLRDEIRTGAPVQTGSFDNSHWLAEKNGRVYYYLGFDARGPVKLSGLSVFETAARPFRLLAHTYAESVVFRDGAWHANEGWVQQFGDATGTSRESFTDRVLDLPGPDVFGASRVDTGAMTFTELRAHIGRLAAGGFPTSDQEVRLHAKIAAPLVTLVMTLLGIPFGLTTGRRGAMYGIGLAIVLAFFYWLLAIFFMAAGSAGLLPPALAAWATNILFLTVAGFLVLTVRT